MYNISSIKEANGPDYDLNIRKYYTLRLYFPYLSLLASRSI
jgi:hypothetical protein